MASNTQNLNLLKKDPIVDATDTFNIETMLNENWDKIDEAVGDIQDVTTAATHAATANTLIKRDANGRAKVAAPSATDDIARKAEVDAAISAAASDATSKVNAHAADAVKHITAAERTGWNAKASTAIATTSANGLLSSVDKSKLDGVASGANNYTHPSTHPASIIAQDASNRFVSDAEKSAWNSKASTAAATASTNGLMSSSDKSKLDGIASGAQVNTVASVAGRTGAITLAKSDVGLANVDNVQQAPISHVGAGGTAHAAATATAAGFMAAADKAKLDGVASGANNYTHPSTHPASIIAQDASNRFVSDAEKSAWNSKASTAAATASTNGLMSSSDKSKLDGIVAGAQPNPGAATTATAGLMSSADKGKLDGIAAGAQVNRTISTQAQAIAGADNTTDMTPLRVREAIDARTRYGVTTGSATALVLTLSPALDSLPTGIEVKVKLHIAAGTNPTLNVNGLGAKALYKSDGTRFVGENGRIYSFIYDGTNFILNSGGGWNAGDVLPVEFQKVVVDGGDVVWEISDPSIGTSGVGSAKQDSSGNIILWTYVNANVSPTVDSVIKLNPVGEKIWSVGATTVTNDVLSAATVDSTGAIITLAARTGALRKYNATTHAVLWTQTSVSASGGSGHLETDSANAVIAAVSSTTSTDQTIRKHSSSGGTSWTKTGYTQIQGIATIGTDIYVLCTKPSNTIRQVYKLNTSGTEQWGTSSVISYSIIKTDAGLIYAGRAGAIDVYNPSGTLVKTVTLPSPVGSAVPYDVQIDAAGFIYVQLSSSYSTLIKLIKMAPTGELLYVVPVDSSILYGGGLILDNHTPGHFYMAMSTKYYKYKETVKRVILR